MTVASITARIAMRAAAILGCIMRCVSWKDCVMGIPNRDGIIAYRRISDGMHGIGIIPIFLISYASNRNRNGAEGEIRTPEDYSSGFRDRRHTGLGYLGLDNPTVSRYIGISGNIGGGPRDAHDRSIDSAGRSNKASLHTDVSAPSNATPYSIALPVSMWVQILSCI